MRSKVDVAYPDLTSLNEALTNATIDGDSAMFRTLIQCIETDINQNINTSDGNGTPLWYATKHGYAAILKLILSQSQVQTDTALVEAARSGNKEIVELLMNAKGACTNDVCPRGEGGGSLISDQI